MAVHNVGRVQNIQHIRQHWLTVSKPCLVIINIRMDGGEDYCPGERACGEPRQAGLQHQFVDSKLDKVNPFQQSLRRSGALSNYSIRLSGQKKYVIRPLAPPFFSCDANFNFASLLPLPRRNQGQNERGAQKIFLLSATRHRAKRPAGAEGEQLRRCSRESTDQQTSGSPTPAWVRCVCACVKLSVCVSRVSTDWQQSERRTDGEQFNKTIILISRRTTSVS